jgi:hypothetical protein
MSDIFAAFGVGISETLIGHPFNTAKVLIQNKKKWYGLPWKQYYRGVRYPLVSGTFFNMIVFPIKERTYQYTHNYFVSGILAGIMVTPSVFFIDTFTIKRQTNQSVSLSMFKGAKGGQSTMLRETVALSTYFGTYHWMRDDQKYNSLISGGAAGLANWTVSYPLDVIRSRQIAQRITIKEAVKMGNFWKGFSIAAIRSVIVNAISFTVFENCKQYFDLKFSH